MNLDRVGSGKQLPDDINVIIEIPSHSDPVKYEVDKETGALFVDRFMNTAMFYPCNYGYIPHTLSDDGDPVDVLVMSPYALLSGSVVQCRPVGMLKMTDESGEDAKIIAVPHDVMYDDVQDIGDISKRKLDKLAHFFEHYKDLEKK
jgi:inorganic pyrophosphatase